MGTLWPKNWKTQTFLLITEPYLNIESCVMLLFKASSRSAFLFLTLTRLEQYMGTLWPKNMKIDDLTVVSVVWFTVSVLSDLLKDSDFIGIFYCFSYFGTILIIIIIIIIILSFRITPLTYEISETAQHWITKLHSYIDPYPTTCSARFGVDPDYHSGSRAKSVFSDSPHHLKNLSSDLQLQYL